MHASPHIDLNIRSYAVDLGADRHDFAQLVLPLGGRLFMDIGGRERAIDRGHAAFVGAGNAHSQVGEASAPHSAIILDLDAARIDPAVMERLSGAPYVPLSPAAHKLVDFITVLLRDQGSVTGALPFWTPLILDALAQQPAHARSRLTAMMAQVEADPGAPWTTERMAARAGTSVSRLHAHFRDTHDTTPHAWLTGLRMERVRQLLTDTDLPIATLAYQAGFADQSALTRAMRRTTGLTPSAYRKLHRPAGR